MRFAPRYDPLILDALRALDDRTVSIAEVNRRVGAAAERLGLTRPSYAHLRRIVHVERDRHDAIRAVVEDVVTDLVLGLRVDAYDVAGRVQDARAGRD